MFSGWLFGQVCRDTVTWGGGGGGGAVWTGMQGYCHVLGRLFEQVCSDVGMFWSSYLGRYTGMLSCGRGACLDRYAGMLCFWGGCLDVQLQSPPPYRQVCRDLELHLP